MVSMSHSLLLRDLSILPTPVRWRSEYVHIVAQSREYVHTTYRVEVCPTRYEVATPILPRPQSYLSGGIPPRPRLAKGFLLCISYEVLGRSVWACGVSRWTPSLGDLIIPFIFSLISYTTYSNCTAIYCTILLFEYALITIRETASFSKGCSRVCLLGLHAATSP